jgi:hypothetical protein
MRKLLPLLSFAAFLLLIVASAYVLFFVQKAPAGTISRESDAADTELAPGFATPASSTEVVAATLRGPRTAPAGTKEYRNTHYRFALFYPKNLEVREYDEGEGARTITFQDVRTAEGFQIFVVPYTASQVSMQRFKMDEPSGVMRDPQNLNIDGAFATMFLGKNDLLGDTREVWFIRGGYLFEVTAPLSLDNWLGNSMLSWIFI